MLGLFQVEAREDLWNVMVIYTRILDMRASLISLDSNKIAG